jgi:hypothetical protein
LNLLSEQNDNNVKLIVLSKIMDMRGRYAKLLEDYVSDIIGATIGSSAAGSGAAKDDSSAVIQSLDIN